MTTKQIAFNFDNSYSRLPDIFYENVDPQSVKQPRLITFNKALGQSLGIQNLESNELLAETFSGNSIPNGSNPIALAYAGHQFGHFVNQLGDGRAVLLGEVINGQNERFDIQLKGSGKTKFSRQGDGRSALGPVIREYILSEAMYALNVPTTRALAAVTSGEDVYREIPLPGGVFTRVAKSHIRVGTFEYFIAQNDHQNLKILADYVIERLYPEALDADNPYLEMLYSFADKQSKLIGKWMGIGFIHGVMNTDNTSVAGETIDYGPCAFMDEYNPQAVFSSIDHHGRYAFAKQPQIAQWNLACLASCLLSLVDKNETKAKEEINALLTDFSTKVNKAISTTMVKKIGLDHKNKEHAEHLKKLLKIMHKEKPDYTLSFRHLSDVINNKEEAFKSQFTNKDLISDWINSWKALLNKQPNKTDDIYHSMNSVNPLYIPRNHLVERAIKLAIDDNDFSYMLELSKILDNPFTKQDVHDDFSRPPTEDEKVHQTFCGT